jgi:hypothetical protein
MIHVSITDAFLVLNNVFQIDYLIYGRSQRPRGLGRWSAAARLLRLRVRIPPEARVSVSCDCWSCQVELAASGWSFVQRSPTECGVSECDRAASKMRRTRPTRAVAELD